MGGTYRQIPRQYLLACRAPPTENLAYFDIILGNLSMVLREQKPFHLTYPLPPNVSYADMGRKLREWYLKAWLRNKYQLVLITALSMRTASAHETIFNGYSTIAPTSGQIIWQHKVMNKGALLGRTCCSKITSTLKVLVSCSQGLELIPNWDQSNLKLISI